MVISYGESLWPGTSGGKTSEVGSWVKPDLLVGRQPLSLFAASNKVKEWKTYKFFYAVILIIPGVSNTNSN